MSFATIILLIIRILFLIFVFLFVLAPFVGGLIKSIRDKDIFSSIHVCFWILAFSAFAVCSIYSIIDDSFHSESSSKSSVIEETQDMIVSSSESVTITDTYESDTIADTPESDTIADTVYVTDTGKKYHRSDCQYLHSRHPISKSDAIRKGYTACSRCNP